MKLKIYKSPLTFLDLVLKLWNYLENIRKFIRKEDYETFATFAYIRLYLNVAI